MKSQNKEKKRTRVSNANLRLSPLNKVHRTGDLVDIRIKADHSSGRKKPINAIVENIEAENATHPETVEAKKITFTYDKNRPKSRNMLHDTEYTDQDIGHSQNFESRIRKSQKSIPALRKNRTQKSLKAAFSHRPT